MVNYRIIVWENTILVNKKVILEPKQIQTNHKKIYVISIHKII